MHKTLGQIELNLYAVIPYNIPTVPLTTNNIRLTPDIPPLNKWTKANNTDVTMMAKVIFASFQCSPLISLVLLILLSL